MVAYRDLRIGGVAKVAVLVETHSRRHVEFLGDRQAQLRVHRRDVTRALGHRRGINAGTRHQQCGNRRVCRGTETLAAQLDSRCQRRLAAAAEPVAELAAHTAIHRADFALVVLQVAAQRGVSDRRIPRSVLGAKRVDHAVEHALRDLVAVAVACDVLLDLVLVVADAGLIVPNTEHSVELGQQSLLIVLGNVGPLTTSQSAPLDVDETGLQCHAGPRIHVRLRVARIEGEAWRHRATWVARVVRVGCPIGTRRVHVQQPIRHRGDARCGLVLCGEPLHCQICVRCQGQRTTQHSGNTIGLRRVVNELRRGDLAGRAIARCHQKRRVGTARRSRIGRHRPALKVVGRERRWRNAAWKATVERPLLAADRILLVDVYETEEVEAVFAQVPKTKADIGLGAFAPLFLRNVGAQSDHATLEVFARDEIDYTADRIGAIE